MGKDPSTTTPFHTELTKRPQQIFRKRCPTRREVHPLRFLEGEAGLAAVAGTPVNRYPGLSDSLLKGLCEEMELTTVRN